VNKAINGPVTIDVAASYLQKHADAKYFLDTPAAAEL
jgi:glucosamine-6-phosphate deaminase